MVRLEKQSIPFIGKNILANEPAGLVLLEPNISNEEFALIAPMSWCCSQNIKANGPVEKKHDFLENSSSILLWASRSGVSPRYF